MIRFPTKTADAVLPDGIIRAGGTDLMERRRLGIAEGPLVDLRDLPGLSEIRFEGGAAKIGARVTIADVAAHEEIAAGYPGFAEAAGGLATPQIRAVGTLGGSLLQRSRCWYYRNPDANCLKKGGSQCYARAGDHLFHSCFDLGPCIAVHPSTLGMALLAYDATVDIEGKGSRTMAGLLGDGSDPRREHALEAGALLTAVRLPPPVAGERSAYFRTIARARAEWPLVEVLARVVVDDAERITAAAVAVGGVAPIPLRRKEVEAALVGKKAAAATYEAAAKLASAGAKAMPMTEYKVTLLQATVLEALERAQIATSVVAPPPPATPEPEPQPEPQPATETPQPGTTP